MLRAKSVRKLSAASAAGLALAISVAGPAIAVDASFNLNTAVSGTDGFAHADGTLDVDFLANNVIVYTSHVSDRCGRGSGDGEGAYLWLNIRYTNGSYVNGKANLLNSDTNGCDNGTSSVTDFFNSGGKVEWVRFRLDESAGPHGISSSTVYSQQIYPSP